MDDPLAEAQARADAWNLAHGHSVEPLGFTPAPRAFQGFNRRQRRDGTAKRWLQDQAHKRSRYQRPDP